ncbi:MAG TPA: NmrA family NAD(P)-binding protein [bacterium]|nr:NmrA family NAD(P)-binding protein [bacterium]
MSQKTFTIMGATGHIGHVLSEELLKKGHQVRALGRDPEKLSRLKAKGAETLSPSFGDAKALGAAFQGSDGVFLLIPPSYGEPDFSAYQIATGEAIAAAVKISGVKNAVNLSSIGADKPKGNGPIGNLHRMEKNLESIAGLNVVHLRAAYFMENLFYALPVLKGMGVVGTPLRADLKIPMVATRDLGVVSAQRLSALDFQGAEVLEYGGPEDVTMTQATALIGEAIGKPGLPYVQFPYEDAKQGMIGAGMTPQMAGLMIEMNQAFNEGRLEPTRTLGRGTTHLKEFLSGFAAAYRAK